MIRLSVQNFGKLNARQIDLDDGFQLIQGPNEQGKSTLMAFIRAMFFGFSGGGRQIGNNERTRYAPWDGQRMGGSIVFEQAGTRYRLERWFGKARSADRVVLMQDITGTQIPLGGQEEPGNRLLGISENEFVNTVFIRQLGSPIGQGDELLARLGNLAGTGDALISHAEIDKRLRQAQTELVAERGGSGRLNMARTRKNEWVQLRETAVADAVHHTRLLENLQQERTNLKQAMLVRQSLEEQARHQEMRGQLAQWQLILARKDALDQTFQKRNELDETLVHGNFMITAEFIGMLRKLDQKWRDTGLQLEAFRLQSIRARDQLQGLNDQGEAYAKVKLVERAAVKQIQAHLNESHLAAEQQMRELRVRVEKENRLREAANAAELTIASKRVAEGHQNVQNCENQRKNCQNEVERLFGQSEQIKAVRVKNNEAVHQQIEQLTRESENGRDEYHERLLERDAAIACLKAAEDRAGLIRAQKPDAASSSQYVIPRVISKQQLLILSTGVLCLIGGLLGGVLLTQLFFLVAILGALLLGALLLGGQVWQILRQPSGEQQHPDAWEQQNQAVESDVRVAETSLQGAERIVQYAEKTLNETRLRMDTVIRNEKNQLVEQEGIQADLMLQLSDASAALAMAEQQLIQADVRMREVENAYKICQEQIAAQQPLIVNEADERLTEIRSSIASDEQALAQCLLQSGQADWDSLEKALQAMDRHNGQVQASMQEYEHSREAFLGAQTAHDQAAAELMRTYSAYEPVDLPESVREKIVRLENMLAQRDQLSATHRQQEEGLRDLLEGRTWEDWLQNSRKIEQEFALLDALPESLDESQLSILRSQIGQAEAKVMETRERIVALEGEIRHVGQNRSTVSEIDDQIVEVNRQISAMEQYHNSLGLARSALDAASAELQNSFGPELNQNTAQILGRLTLDKYEDLKVDRSLAVRLADPVDKVFHDWQYLSGGTIDQIYLALRLAISDRLSSLENRMPLLLDDVLLQYDDSRAEAAIRCLMEKSQAESQQMLFFTCQNRLTEIVRQACLPVVQLR